MGKKIPITWLRLAGAVLNLRVQCHGTLATEPSLIVANHISWLDIVAIGSLIPTSFVAKDDVRGCPIIGALANMCGTLFIQRKSISSLRKCIDNITDALLTNKHVTLFPEGTSTNGKRVLPFHAGLFKAAIDAEVPVQAVAIRYIRDSKMDTVAPYIDDMLFFNHLLRILWMPATHVALYFCEPLVNSSAKVLALTSNRQIHHALNTAS